MPDRHLDHPLTLVASAPGRPGRALRVAVLSGHLIVRDGLTQLLSHDTSRVEVVAGPASGGDPGGHDVVVFDLLGDLVGQPGLIPNDLVALLAERVPIVALASNARSQLTETALALGVTEVVHLGVDAAGLLRAVERAAVDQEAAQPPHRRRHGVPTRIGDGLTDREISILELVGSGLQNEDIAARLCVSINTVKTHIRSAYRKIGVTRRAEAVLWAVHQDASRAR